MIATTGVLATVDIDVGADRPERPTWDCVSDTEFVEGWFKPENADLPNIDGVSATLGAETNPEMTGVATGSAVDGVVEVEGCEVKLDDNEPLEVGFSRVEGKTCWGSVASPCRSSASVASASSTSPSFVLVFVQMSSMTLEVLNSP